MLKKIEMLFWKQGRENGLLLDLRRHKVIYFSFPLPLLLKGGGRRRDLELLFRFFFFGSGFCVILVFLALTLFLQALADFSFPPSPGVLHGWTEILLHFKQGFPHGINIIFILFLLKRNAAVVFYDFLLKYIFFATHVQVLCLGGCRCCPCYRSCKVEKRRGCMCWLHVYLLEEGGGVCQNTSHFLPMWRRMCLTAECPPDDWEEVLAGRREHSSWGVSLSRF